MAPDHDGDAELVEYDPREESVTTTVVRTVASLRGVDASELTRLHDVIDPDALDTIFPLDGGRSESASVAVRFRYEGFEATVTRRHVLLRDLEAD